MDRNKDGEICFDEFIEGLERSGLFSPPMSFPPIKIQEALFNALDVDGTGTWTDPWRMLEHKVLYFTLGLDSLPIRRTATIANEKRRVRAIGSAPFSSATDPNGYRRARYRQAQQWYKRIQYQEFYLQHLSKRFA